MNDLIRPALYGAYHHIENLTVEELNDSSSHKTRAGVATQEKTAPTENPESYTFYDVTGPVCESDDVWGTDRRLPESHRGDLLAISSVGAYGSVMSSRYNLRDIAPAVFSDDLVPVPSPLYANN